MIKDIWRKIEGDGVFSEIFAIPLSRARQIHGQRQRQRGWKLYSWHAPETECFGKGKDRSPYEFGCKVSVTTTNRRCKGGQFVLHAKALHGNPYDGHTLGVVIPETQARTGPEIKRIYVEKDMLATTRRSRSRLSAQVKNEVSTARSNANYDDAPPSSRLSDI